MDNIELFAEMTQAQINQVQMSQFQINNVQNSNDYRYNFISENYARRAQYKNDLNKIHAVFLLILWIWYIL